MLDNLTPVEIAENTYWVGKRDDEGMFHANPYLRLYSGTERSTGKPNRFNLLINPGSSSDFSVVSQKVSRLIGGLQNTSAIYINHQCPDVGSSAPLITARFAPKASVICSEDTFRLISPLGLRRDRFVATERAREGVITLPTGQRMQVVPSPFCHFRGAVMLYDPQTRVLFSGDLFAGLTEQGTSRLDAVESDWTGVRAVHQLYMPSGAAIRRVINAIRKLDPFPEVLAPHQGFIVRGDLVEDWLDRLYHLPVGLDIIDEDDTSTLDGWNHVFGRVLELSRSLLGATADTRLADDRRLEDFLSFDSGQPTIRSLGRVAVEKIVETLTRNELPSIANVIKMEVLAAADQLDLPVPRIHIGEFEESTVDDHEFDFLAATG